MAARKARAQRADVEALITEVVRSANYHP